MSQRTGNAQIVDLVTSVVAAASGANPAVILTYTCPAGKTACLRFWTISKFTGAPTVAVYITVGGVKVELDRGTAQTQQALNHNLNPGDTCTVEVVTGVAASVFDTTVSLEEYSIL